MTDPTPRHDANAIKLAEDWDSARVIRLWERWRLAKEAYLGSRVTNTPGSRKLRMRSKGHRKRGDAETRYLQSLAKWLTTNPQRETRAAYDAFAEHHNAHLYPDEQPVVRSETIRRGLPLAWLNSIAVARGELTMEEAIEAELAEQLPPYQEDALVGLAAIGRLLNRSHASTRTLANTDGHFPIPVAHIGKHRAWLYEDIKLYKRGFASPKRQEDELEHLFMDSEELRTNLGLSQRTLRLIIINKRWDRAPQPEGAIAKGYYYWKRAKVQIWPKQKEADQRKGEQQLKEQARAQVIASSLKAPRSRHHRKRNK